MTRTLRRAIRGLAAATVLLAAPAAGAQPRGDAGLDVTLARHAIRGGTIDVRAGALLDVLAAGRVRAASRWSLGAGDRSLGLLARLDLGATVLARLGLGAMLRASGWPRITILPRERCRRAAV